MGRSANVRSSLGGSDGGHRDVKDYTDVYKPAILFFALVDQMFALCFGKHVSQPSGLESGSGGAGRVPNGPLLWLTGSGITTTSSSKPWQKFCQLYRMTWFLPRQSMKSLTFVD